MNDAQKTLDRLIISYAFGDLDPEQTAMLEADPHRLQSELTRLYMDFVDQRSQWEEKVRVGEVSPDEYHDWRRRSSSIRSKLQGKAPHVRLLVRNANITRTDDLRRGESRRLRRAIRDHRVALEAADAEPESWDLELWAIAEEVAEDARSDG